MGEGDEEEEVGEIGRKRRREGVGEERERGKGRGREEKGRKGARKME